jgi:Family of unknown function (DUF5996)
MPLPALFNWQPTRDSLQRAAQVISAVRAEVTPPLPNAMRLSLNVTPEGLSTGPLPFGGDLALDFTDLSIAYRQPGETAARLSLKGHSQWSLAGAVLNLLAEEGHDIRLNRDKLADQSPLHIDAHTAEEYADTLFSVFTAAARFRARLFGPQSPVVVWPHGFDLSFLWFAGAGSNEHQDKHMNFGFSPGSPGFERPYLYSYASPNPAGLADVPLPILAHVNTQPWTGIVVHYDDLVNTNDSEAVIEALYSEIYRAVSPLLV